MVAKSSAARGRFTSAPPIALVKSWSRLYGPLPPKPIVIGLIFGRKPARPHLARAHIAGIGTSPRPQHSVSRNRAPMTLCARSGCRSDQPGTTDARHRAGFFEDEYRQYGWEFPSRPATRIRQMEEAVQLILKMWTEPRTTFHGRYFHVEDAILEPKPVQKPRPPVMIAGGGEQLTLRAVANLADACNIVDGDVAEVRHKLAVLRGHCDAAGRDYDTIEKPVSSRGCLPATRPRWRQSASGWSPADHCAALSVPCPRRLT